MTGSSLRRDTKFSLLLEARFSKVTKSFRTRKAIAKFQTLWLQSCFLYIFLIWTWPEVSLHTRSSRRIHLSVLDSNLLKMALRARKVSGAFEVLLGSRFAPKNRDHSCEAVNEQANHFHEQNNVHIRDLQIGLRVRDWGRVRFSNFKSVTFPEPSFFMSVLGRESITWDEMGMCCDNVKPDN